MNQDLRLKCINNSMFLPTLTRCRKAGLQSTSIALTTSNSRPTASTLFSGARMRSLSTSFALRWYYSRFCEVIGILGVPTLILEAMYRVMAGAIEVMRWLVGMSWLELAHARRVIRAGFWVRTVGSELDSTWNLDAGWRSWHQSSSPNFFRSEPTSLRLIHCIATFSCGWLGSTWMHRTCAKRSSASVVLTLERKLCF